MERVLRISKNQTEAQRSGFGLERKKELTDMKLSLSAEAQWSQLLLTLSENDVRIAKIIIRVGVINDGVIAT